VQKDINNQTWLTRKEIAEHLKLSLRQIDYMTAEGQLPFTLIGARTKRYHKPTIDELLLGQQQGGNSNDQ
jgi:excisionase family DNA binding protein